MRERVSVPRTPPVVEGRESCPAGGSPEAIRTILCATDLSEASDRAWQVARQLGLACRARVLLLHVIAPIAVGFEDSLAAGVYAGLVDDLRRDAEARLAALAAPGAEPGPKLETRLDDGPPARRILEVAAETGADLVVLGTHGRTGLPRLLLGSVADRLVRQADVPVVTVRAERTAAPVRPLRWGRILYATDFSPTAASAWPWVHALAEAMVARVDLLHVTPMPVGDRSLAPETVVNMARSLEAEGRARAEHFLQTAGIDRGRVSIVIGRGAVADQIVHRAADRAADLIVLGTHGWSGLTRWMLGSVAHQVIQAAPCAVLTLGPASKGAGERPAP
jgi:nucleotide-binding universal stress UspA family protein